MGQKGKVNDTSQFKPGFSLSSDKRKHAAFGKAWCTG